MISTGVVFVVESNPPPPEPGKSAEPLGLTLIIVAAQAAKLIARKIND